MVRVVALVALVALVVSVSVMDATLPERLAGIDYLSGRRRPRRPPLGSVPVTVAAAPPIAGFGELLRDWRRRRRLSQLDLALEAEVSARHLSFIETGRSRPSRELVLHLSEHLDVPLRERNSLLLAAGYAPMFRETPLDADSMAPVRAALDKVLAGHEPYPAVIVDRAWDLVSANRAALAVLADGVDPELLAPPVNAMRVCLHPDGLAPRTTNLAEYGGHLLVRLRRQVALAPDARLAALYEELIGYPGMAAIAGAAGIGGGAGSGTMAVDPASMVFVPLELETTDGTRLRFFSTLATFGTAVDVTLAELSIESFFPGDAATEAYLRRG
jgi:transcriptional regulator with XRE-family HTH domain